MNIKDFMIAANFRLGEGSEYMWQCYGPDARFLDIALGSTEDSCSAIFDTKTGEVYQIDVCVGDSDSATRWLNLEYRDALYAEARQRGVDMGVAYDDIPYIDIGSEMLMLQIVSDLVNKKPKEEKMSCENKCPDCDCADEPVASAMTNTESREYKVTIEVAYEMDVKASSMEEAATKGKEFVTGMKPEFSSVTGGVCWMDRYVSKETVSRDLRVESITE